MSQAVSRGEPPSELARGVSNWATTALRGWRSGNRMLCMGAGGTVGDGKLYPARKARGCQEAEARRRGVRDLRTRADSSQRYRAHGIRGRRLGKLDAVGNGAGPSGPGWPEEPREA